MRQSFTELTLSGLLAPKDLIDQNKTGNNKDSNNFCIFIGKNHLTKTAIFDFRGGWDGRHIPDLITWIVTNPAQRLPTPLVLRQEAWLENCPPPPTHPPTKDKLGVELLGL